MTEERYLCPSDKKKLKKCRKLGVIRRIATVLKWLFLLVFITLTGIDGYFI